LQVKVKLASKTGSDTPQPHFFPIEGGVAGEGGKMIKEYLKEKLDWILFVLDMMVYLIIAVGVFAAIIFIIYLFYLVFK
jgi:hypothetical protein